MSIYGWFGSGLIVKYMIAEHEMRDQIGIIVCRFVRYTSFIKTSFMNYNI
jgi:hypothetical protein